MSDFVSALDDDAFQSIVLEGISQMLTDAGDDGPRLADDIGHRILRLRQGPAKQAGFGRIAGYVSQSPSIVDLALQLTTDSAWEARSAGLEALLQIPGDPRVRTRVLALMNDEHPNVRTAALKSYPQMRAIARNSADRTSLQVFPDEQDRAEITALLDQLLRDIYRLEETELDDEQRSILTDEMLPTTRQLIDLAGGSASSGAEVREKRRSVLERMSRLAGAASALHLAIDAVGKSDEAANNVASGVKAVGAAGVGLWHLLGG